MSDDAEGRVTTGQVNEFLREAYGDPCRTCGYKWSTGADICRDIIQAAPERFEVLLAGRNGSERCDDLGWNTAAYVIHLADVLRIWADRLAGAALGSSAAIVPYDEGRLGDVRGYVDLPLTSGLWALHRAVGDWLAAEDLAWATETVLNHPEQGPLGVDEVRRIMAHETEHHAADVIRILSS